MAYDDDLNSVQDRAVSHDPQLVLDPPVGGLVLPQVPLECIPVVTAINPPQSLVLRDVTITGQKFMPTATTCGPVNIPPIVTFLDSHPGGPLVGAVSSFNDTQITVRVPNGAKTGLVTVANTRGILSPVPGGLTVLPAIDSLVRPAPSPARSP